MPRSADRLLSVVVFEILKAYPPDRDGVVAELTVRHGGLIDIPAEIYREDGELKITLFGRETGPAWTYPLSEWVAAVNQAAEALHDQ